MEAKKPKLIFPDILHSGTTGSPIDTPLPGDLELLYQLGVGNDLSREEQAKDNALRRQQQSLDRKETQDKIVSGFSTGLTVVALIFVAVVIVFATVAFVVIALHWLGWADSLQEDELNLLTTLVLSNAISFAAGWYKVGVRN